MKRRKDGTKSSIISPPRRLPYHSLTVVADVRVDLRLCHAVPRRQLRALLSTCDFLNGTESSLEPAYPIQKGSREPVVEAKKVVANLVVEVANLVVEVATGVHRRDTHSNQWEHLIIKWYSTFSRSSNTLLMSCSALASGARVIGVGCAS
jgi:hypothetical protein